MANFVSTTTRDIGGTPVTIYTAVSKGVVIGINATNIYGSALPLSITHRRSAVDTFFVQNKYVEPAETAALIVGNKLVVEAGDQLLANTYTGITGGFDVIISALEGV
jgi:hypothetical protein